MVANDQDNRREYRQRVLKGATIIINLSKPEIRCTIRNQHANGAELHVAADNNIPSEFVLFVPTDGTAYRCEKQWRKGERVGVRFLGKLPKPRHHYG
jgi:hypothetical protein